jgi:hypothetical protein
MLQPAEWQLSWNFAPPIDEAALKFKSDIQTPHFFSNSSGVGVQFAQPFSQWEATADT